ncbi:hypothetical protein F3Y22_tig00116970pilonHSYRG00203 [Hibiscus syriacus]|uniref:CHCH domain-containing protein n=1 Tax=Hibiscus syriacus TaxID=106335 RepID=A0A6A2XQX4_HIBSY|nr:hypothetical protein F3Y22_tig00116970pilonHSYRG00203 [Hibiscus syriacus]
MANVVDAAGEPIPTSRKILTPRNVSIRAAKLLAEPLDCLKIFIRDAKIMEGYVGCMYYHTNEFDLCRKQQQAFEKACPLE